RSRGARIDVDVRRAGNVKRVTNGQRLAARRLERGDEGPDPIAQGAVGRQDRLAVAAAKVNYCAIDGRVIELVLSRDGETERGARCGPGWSTDGKMSGRRGTDHNAVARAVDGRTGCVGSRDGLIARGLKRGAESASPVVQGAVRRQDGLGIAAGEMNRAG